MLPGSENAKNGSRSRHRTHRNNSTAKCFAKNHHVWHDALVLTLECRTGPTEARLNLIKDQKHVAVFGHLAHPSQIPLGRHDDPRLTLNGLKQDGNDRVIHRLF
ncbi:unannotated protein [freshwater metagenome]|uniref:Unannotated protein n=1 Tax=freshwater metagenome TaxID=449393 RepID=A0A6J6JLA6_9ZZZZ